MTELLFLATALLASGVSIDYVTTLRFSTNPSFEEATPLPRLIIRKLGLHDGLLACLVIELALLITLAQFLQLPPDALSLMLVILGSAHGVVGTNNIRLWWSSAEPQLFRLEKNV